MGGFVSLSSVVGADTLDVDTALREFARQYGGTVRAATISPEDEHCLIVAEGNRGATVLYPAGFFGWEEASQFIAKELRKPTFSFHIHDGDFWMYVLFSTAGAEDRFNPLVDYWGESDEFERQKWRGDAEQIAKWAGIQPALIARYLVTWSDLLETKVRGKAYPDDEHTFGDAWQLLDFMSRLGLPYPKGKQGAENETSYFFRVDAEEESEDE